MELDTMINFHTTDHMTFGLILIFEKIKFKKYKSVFKDKNFDFYSVPENKDKFWNVYFFEINTFILIFSHLENKYNFIK